MKNLVFLALFFFASITLATSKKLLILGDSLTEGFGVSRESAFPSVLEKLIQKDHPEWRVINAGISGSTTASALNRVKWHLKDKPDILMLSLGANDGLRGLPVKEAKKNLTEAIELAKKEKIPVLLAGMMMPPNYGKTYREDFRKIFQDIAKDQKIPLVPFLLEGVAGDPKLNLPDGIHPNEKGHQILAKNVFKVLKPMLGRQKLGSQTK